MSDTPVASHMYANTKPELAATSPVVAGIASANELEGNNKPGTQHTELPSYAPGGQPYTHIAGGEMDTSPVHSHYVENAAPYYPEVYAAPPPPPPPPPTNQAQASRLAQLEASQRELEERMSRMRQLSAMEEEHARLQAEIARLRNS